MSEFWGPLHKEQNDFFEEDIKSTDASSHIRLKQFVRDPFSSAYFIKKIDKISELLHELTTNIDNQHSIHDYITYRIEGFLTREFKGQIQFTPSKSELSSLKLGNKLELSLDITLQNNTIQTNKESFRGTPFDKVYLIDNPYIIDTIRHKIEDKQSISEFSLSSNKTSDYFQDLKIEEHAQQLLKSIKVDILQSSFEDINIKEKYANLLKILNQVVPGELTFKESGDRDLYYFHHGEYLNASNLATGMKSFAIIKLLLRQQCLDSDTMLILDEPESHLHPAWQNLYAELITLLVKEHQVNILLTTHSANFVLALEAAMYKHQLGDVSNFYRTSKCNERQVQYDLANEISFIYDDLIEHFAQAKILRDQYAESYPLS